MRGRAEDVLAPRTAALAAVLTLALLLVSTLLAGCGGGEGRAKVRVAVDIVPWAALCRELGGEHVEVEVMVPPGSSPHTYELSAGQARFLAEADILVINGLGLTPWAEEYLSGGDNPDLQVVVAADAVRPEELIPVYSETPDAGDDQEGDGRADEGPFDPHLWLDPVLVLEVTGEMEEGLVAADPEHETYYRQRAREVREEILALHQEATRRTAAFTHREFISFHSTWIYFARRYGLSQVGVIEERPGKEPSAREIAELVRLARSLGVRAIFAEAQFDPRVAEAVAEESAEQVRVWVLDPLGDLKDPRKGDYCSLIRYNLDIMEEALR